LKKSFRVKREKDFKAIFKDGTSFANRKFVVYQLESLVEHVDFVVIARKGVETLEYAEMEKNLLHVLKLSKIYQEGNGSEKETTVD